MSFFQRFHGIELADNGEIRKLRPEVVTEDPVATAPGRLWYNAADHKLKFSDTDEATGELITRIVLDEEEVKRHVAASAKMTEGIAVRATDPAEADREPGMVWINTTQGVFKFADGAGAARALAEDAGDLLAKMAQLEADLRTYTDEKVASEMAVREAQLTQLDGDLRAHTAEAIDAYDTATRTLVTQTGHGFTKLTPVCSEGGLWRRANASAGNTLAVAVVAEVIDADTFELRHLGRIPAPGHGLVVGEYYYLSDGADGAISRTEPKISQPLYYVEDVDHVIALQYRPSVTPDPNLHQLVWKDLVAPLSTAKPTGGSMPTWESVGGSAFYAYAFVDNKVNEAVVTFHLSHDYALGTDLYPHIHWIAGDGTVGTVRWVMELAYAKGHSQAPFNLHAPVQVIVEQASDGTPFKHYIAEGLCSNFTAALEPDGLILMRVYRDATHPNDTFAGSAYALQADLHHQSNMIGTINKAPNFYG